MNRAAIGYHWGRLRRVRVQCYWHWFSDWGWGRATRPVEYDQALHIWLWRIEFVLRWPGNSRAAMSARMRDRCDALQWRLRRAGVTAMHLSWSDTRGMTVEQKAEDACVVLESYLNGKCTPFDVGDLDAPDSRTRRGGGL